MNILLRNKLNIEYFTYNKLKDMYNNYICRFEQLLFTAER